MVVSIPKLISWASFTLANGKVHVWHASLEQPEEVIRKLEAVLSNEERQRAEQARHQQGRQSFVASRGILRILLSQYTGITPEQIEFKYTLAGKPYLAGREQTLDISFNLSYDGLLVLYAFSWGREVGIDVECIRPIDKMDEVARQTFSPEEYRYFRGLHGETRLTAFFNAWTRKEAFVKAAGYGSDFSRQDFEVSLEPDFPAELLTVAGSRELAARWSMHDIKTWDGYAAALVVEGHDYSISHKQWAYSHFLQESQAGQKQQNST